MPNPTMPPADEQARAILVDFLKEEIPSYLLADESPLGQAHVMHQIELMIKRNKIGTFKGERLA